MCRNIYDRFSFIQRWIINQFINPAINYHPPSDNPLLQNKFLVSLEECKEHDDDTRNLVFRIKDVSNIFIKTGESHFFGCFGDDQEKELFIMQYMDIPIFDQYRQSGDLFRLLSDCCSTKYTHIKSLKKNKVKVRNEIIIWIMNKIIFTHIHIIENNPDKSLILPQFIFRTLITNGCIGIIKYAHRKLLSTDAEYKRLCHITQGFTLYDCIDTYLREMDVWTQITPDFVTNILYKLDYIYRMDYDKLFNTLMIHNKRVFNYIIQNKPKRTIRILKDNHPRFRHIKLMINTIKEGKDLPLISFIYSIFNDD